MKKQYTTQDIERMLGRFMDGLSTLDEEQALAEYFRSHDVCDAWVEYKEMFALFDNGEVDVAPELETVVVPSAADKPKSKVIPLRWILTGVAASIAILIGISTFVGHDEPHTDTATLAKINVPTPSPSPSAQQESKPVTEEKDLQPVTKEMTVVAQVKTSNQNVSNETPNVKRDDDRPNTNTKEARMVAKLLNDADLAFSQAVMKCVNDINESVTMEEEQNETDYETYIII